MSARDVAVVSYAEFTTPSEPARNEIEMLMPVVGEALGAVGMEAQQIGFTVSGSSDYLQGQAFAFVTALDAIGAWPPIRESHVEMDGAFALYEAWMVLQHGLVDTALVYAFGRPSRGDLARLLALQLDPYLLAPMFPDAVSLAGLQARALLDSGTVSERDIAEVAARSRRDAGVGTDDADALLAQPYFADPLRRHDICPVSDGAAAMVLAVGDRARELSEHPVWIRGMATRIEPPALGVRDLTDSPSTRRAGEVAGVAEGPVDVAELHAPFAHQELIVRRALGLNGSTRINPSGGALIDNPMMVAGLARVGHASRELAAGRGRRAVAHATSGPCLQQNLVCVLERD